MTMPAALVVATWGAINGALVATLAGFGAKPVLLALYGSAAMLVELIAVAVWFRQRRVRAGRRHLPNGDSIPLYAVAVLIVGLSLAYYWPLAPLAVAPLYLGVAHQISQRRGSA
jgi:hypothetical protein